MPVQNLLMLSFFHKAGIEESVEERLEEILKIKFSQNIEAEVWSSFLINLFDQTLSTRTRFGQDFVVDVCMTH